MSVLQTFRSLIRSFNVMLKIKYTELAFLLCALDKGV